MRNALFSLAIAVTVFALPLLAASNEPGKLSATDRKNLLAAKQVTPLQTMHEIPAEVVEACKDLGGYGEFKLADPGQPFQATDVITEKHLLGRRLIWAVRFPGYVVIHYESGGVAHSFHVVVIAVNSSRKARVLWETDTRPGTSNSFAEFQAALASGKFDPACRPIILTVQHSRESRFSSRRCAAPIHAQSFRLMSCSSKARSIGM